MLSRVVQFCAVLTLCFAFFAADVAADETAVEAPELASSTMAKQTAVTGAMTTIYVGSSMWMFSYREEVRSGPLAAIIVAPLVIFGGGLLIASPLIAPRFFNLTRPSSELPRVRRFPILGSVIGGLAGGAFTVAMYNQVDLLEWRARRLRTAHLIGLPMAAGLTLGAMLGYAYQHNSRSSEVPASEVDRAPNEPIVTPVVGAPMGSDDQGWTLGTQIRF